MAVVDTGVSMAYEDDVKFKAVLSRQTNCICNGCHRGGQVQKITYPTTLYHDGKHLSTKYREFWLCGDCLGKLKKAIENPKEEK